MPIGDGTEAVARSLPVLTVSTRCFIKGTLFVSFITQSNGDQFA